VVVGKGWFLPVTSGYCECPAAEKSSFGVHMCDCYRARLDVIRTVGDFIQPGPLGGCVTACFGRTKRGGDDGSPSPTSASSPVTSLTEAPATTQLADTTWRSLRAASPLLLGGAAAVAVVLGGLYLAILLRDVGYGTDTAKFQYLGRVLGTAHQPGYPLFTALLAVTVRMIPVGGDALRVGVVSAVGEAGAPHRW
jgi:hypothetical protein